MALGARAGQVRRIVVGQAGLLTLLGIAVGLSGAWGLSRFMESLLFGVSARDPWIFGGVPLALGLVALLAGCVPARRATQVNPVQALQNDGGHG